MFPDWLTLLLGFTTMALAATLTFGALERYANKIFQPMLDKCNDLEAKLDEVYELLENNTEDE